MQVHSQWIKIDKIQDSPEILMFWRCNLKEETTNLINFDSNTICEGLQKLGTIVKGVDPRHPALQKALT